MKTDVTITAAELRNALDAMVDAYPVDSHADLRDDANCEIEVTVDAEEIAQDAGFVDPDDARADIMSDLAPTVRDLEDGLRHLIDGDRGMASIMLSRAFDAWPDARLAVETLLGGRTARDRRQLLLVA